MEPETTPQWVVVANVDEFSECRAKECIVGQHIIALFYDEGSFFALDGLCAHQGGPVAKGELSKTDAGKTCVTCPWHGWQYELATGIQTVNRQPLQRTFPVRERDGKIEIQI